MIITVFQILTVGGKELWVEDDSLDIENDILVPNGIYLCSPPTPLQQQGIFLCNVDTVKTNIADFYKWEEIQPNDSETFCWRTCYSFGEKNNYCNWLPIPINEYIGKYTHKELLHMIHTSLNNP